MCRNFCALRRDLRVVNITLEHLETMSSHVCRPEETRGFEVSKWIPFPSCGGIFVL